MSFVEKTSAKCDSAFEKKLDRYLKLLAEIS